MLYDMQLNTFVISIAVCFVPFMVIIVLTAIAYNNMEKWLEAIEVKLKGGLRKGMRKFIDKLDFPVKTYWYPILIGFIFLIIALATGNTPVRLGNWIISEARILDISEITNLIPYVFVFQPFMYVIMGFGLGLYFLYKDVTRRNHNSEIIKDRKRKKDKLEDPSRVPLDYSKNIAIIGKNGSGKTVAISNFVKGHIENPNRFCVIMDGKGDIGEYSLYDIVSKLCIKHNRKLYILNQSMPDETHSYNPFIGCNSTQIKDMLLAMSDWSEEHYKALAGEYFQALAQVLIDTNTDVSFNSLIEYGLKANFIEKINKDFKLKKISERDFLYYTDVINRCGDTVQGSISRFSTLARGIGSKMFRDGKSFNLQLAYKEKAVVLVLLNNLEYSDFARGVGLLVINDIKNVLGSITKIKGFHEQFLCVYDELSVYFSEMMIDIVNKSRSLGGTNILSTQTIADMDIIDENARRIVINNMHGFFLLKQADDKSAETLSKAIGTKKATEITSKIDSYGKTGDGTSKIIDEFKVHPNDLKELPLGIGYWVDTMSADYKPIRTKLPFVDVSDMKPYVFKDLDNGFVCEYTKDFTAEIISEAEEVKETKKKPGRKPAVNKSIAEQMTIDDYE